MQSKSNNLCFEALSRNEKIIFLAGIFDGEGSFGLWKNNPKRRVYLTIAVESTDVDMVTRFVEVFGGPFFCLKARKEHWKNSFRWKVTGEKAWQILEQMIPYMCQRRRDKYATLEPHRYSPENSGGNISKQEESGRSSIGG